MNTTMKKVMVIVPMRTGESMESINEKQQKAEETYRNVRTFDETDDRWKFVNTVGMVVDDTTLAEAGFTHPRVKNLINGLECLISCDDVIFGEGFNNMRYGRVMAHICNEYKIPAVAVFKKGSKYGEKLKKNSNNITVVFTE